MLNKLEKIRKSRKSYNSGFTIIEVMIVLAIGALIILIVLLAIPSLQRNARNTTMKNDAASVSAATSEFKSNNEGLSPNSVTGTTPNFSITRTGGAAVVPAPAKVSGGTTVVGQATVPAIYTPATVTTIYVVYNQKCVNSNFAGAASLTANTRATAIIYPVEQRTGNPSGKCTEA